MGTDTAGYGILSYQFAQVESFSHFFWSGTFSSWSYLIKPVVWITSRIGRNQVIFFFILELLAIAPALYAITENLECDEQPLGLFLYVLLFYPMSLNLMRQCIAMGFLLCAYLPAQEKKRIRFLLFVLIASGFHITALIGLLIYPTIQALAWDGFKKRGVLASVLIALFLLCSTARYWMHFLAQHLGLFEAYFDGSPEMAGDGERIMLEIIFLFLLGYLVRVKVCPIKTESPTIRNMGFLVSMGAVVFSLCLTSFWLYRLSLYFLQFSVMVLPVILNRNSQAKPTKLFYLLLSVAILLLFSFDYYDLSRSNEVVPYSIIGMQ